MIDEVRRTLNGAHLKGHAHGDIQLDNILVRTSQDNFELQIKITDWATSRSDAPSMLRDVSQTAEVFEQILANASEIPSPIAQWIQDAKNRSFNNSKDAWKKLNGAIQKYYIEEA